MLSIGALIWVSVRPLLRLIICTSCGFIITKADIFPPVAARGAGQIILNILMPALMFSRIVPAFTSDNIAALGPLVLVSVLYQGLGLFIAWLVKQFFWVPHRFRHGILVAGCWNNVGDIPTAVIMSITGTSPFNGSTDQTVSVAYISVFILVFFITLFPMGGCRIVAWDYRGPEVDDEELRMSMPAKTKQSIRQLSRSISALRRRIVRRGRGKLEVDSEIEEKNIEDESDEKQESDMEKGCRKVGFTSEADCVEEKEDTPECDCDANTGTPVPRAPQPKRCPKHVSFRAEGETEDNTTVVPTDRVCSPACTITANDGGPSRITSPSPSVTRVDSESASAFNNSRSPSRHVQFRFAHRPSGKLSREEDSKLPESVGPSTTVHPRSRALHHRVFAYTRTIILSMVTPQTITIFTALVVALVPTLKALFTPVANEHIPNAPDGQPPLAFILDTADFIGAASVPMGLVCLGSALARLHVPRSQWRALPLGAISSLAIGKMIAMPILGVVIVQGLTSAGVIDKEDKVLRLVCIFLSCVPTATTQVYLTQVYSGTGEAATLSSFLIPQYALMFVMMTVLSAYTLSLLF